MKRQSLLKTKGPARANNQQANFELKQRVVFALNKLADRDTYQIGVEDLEKAIQSLNPEGVTLFLSCILDTDSEQKSAVRKECIRLMGSLVTFHEGLIGSHLGKMIASIVKRLKDPDSIVRDACVETVGVLASKLSSYQCDDDGVFITLVKPLFEALGEQNRQVQSGAALCLARVIDNTNDPSVSIMQKMLTKTMKLVKSPHFMAKPAVIELHRSIIQAGGAPTRSALSAVLISIQDALKNSDWSTRKAASLSLAEIASSGGSFYSPFKTSCIHSLESCRFDKVKPVRDAILQALHLWRSIPEADTTEPSEAGSSIKESFGGDYGDGSSVSQCGWRDTSRTQLDASSNKKKIPISARKTCQSYMDSPQYTEAQEWHVEIAVPRSRGVALADLRNEESDESSVTKAFGRSNSNIANTRDSGYEYVSMDDRQEYSSVSNPVTDNFETKSMTVSHDCPNDVGLVKQIGTNEKFVAEETSGGPRYLTRMHDHTSLYSTVTESSSQNMPGCCLQTANDIACIQKQLLEIQNQQSNMMDLLKVFITSTSDSLSMIQQKVLSLECTIDHLTCQDAVYGGRHSDLAPRTLTKVVKKSPSLASPRLSSSTPRSSVDMHQRQPSLLSGKIKGRDAEGISGSRSSSSSAQGFDIWSDAIDKGSTNRKPVVKTSQRIFGQVGVTRAPTRSSSEIKISLWRNIKGYLLEGDLESAYNEALCSGDDLALIELVDRTGPVLENLSHKTASDVLGTLASHFLEQRFIISILPWLQQVVDLASIHGPNYLVLPMKARREFLTGLQEAVNLGYCSPSETRSVSQLAIKLQQLWGK